ncbi:hypothetical protein QJQ45_015931, partial [Haematococcus lacustris]
ALVYNAGQYGRAQALRREGTAPAAMGIADDLPTRFAYEQLNALSGMANKVQVAIDRNRKVFEARLRQEDHRVLRQAFGAWRAARYGSIAKQQILRRAIARIQRGTLARAFQAWKDKFHLLDNNLAMRRKVSSTVARGCLKRTFAEWRRLAQERWWKNQYSMRDETIHALERKIAGYERRPIVVLRKRGLSKVLNAWYTLAEERRRRRLRFERAARHFLNQQHLKAWNSWCAFHEVQKRHRNLLTKAGIRIKNMKLSGAWDKWTELIQEKRAAEAKRTKCLRHWLNATLAKVWSAWMDFIDWRREKRKIMSRWIQPMMARALSGWYESAQWRKRMRLVTDRALRRLMNKTLAVAFYTWKDLVDVGKVDAQLTTKQELVLKLRDMQEENERIRRDNERFVRLIDSGEWGRGRVAELVAAGEVMKGERDALLKLIQVRRRALRPDHRSTSSHARCSARMRRVSIFYDSCARSTLGRATNVPEYFKFGVSELLRCIDPLLQGMRREYEAVQQAKEAQVDEFKAIKDRMLLGGAARNRMLVKGGSSFNALVRAMKQDLVEGGAGAGAASRNPNALYEIDKLSLDHVTVFPDGELNVAAVASVPGTAALARPVSAGHWLHASTEQPHVVLWHPGRALKGPSSSLGPGLAPPMQPMRMPQQLAAGMPGAPAGRAAALGLARPQQAPAAASSRVQAAAPVGAQPSAPGSRPQSSQGPVPRDYQRVLDTLSSLTPGEVDRLAALVGAQAGGGALAGPSGLAAGTPGAPALPPSAPGAPDEPDNDEPVVRRVERPWWEDTCPRLGGNDFAEHTPAAYPLQQSGTVLNSVPGRAAKQPDQADGHNAITLQISDRTAAVAQWQQQELLPREAVKRRRAPKQDNGKRLKHTTPNNDPASARNDAIGSDADVAELTQDVLTTRGHNVRAATSASYRRYDVVTSTTHTPRIPPTADRCRTSAKSRTRAVSPRTTCFPPCAFYSRAEGPQEEGREDEAARGQ